MINKIFQYISKHNLIPEGSKILLGLSGGPDSILLLQVLNKYKGIHKFELMAAYLDHEWRENSYLDIQLCSEVCNELKIPLIVKKISELKSDVKFNGSKEELARNQRRFFFNELKNEHQIDYIALAHHLIDQEETFLIRLIRGTTLSGLTCMKPLEGFYIRPLLEIKKNEILDYLNENNIKYITDYTNESHDFLRNRIRNKVINELQSVDSRFDDNFLRTLTKLQETEEFLKRVIEQKFVEISTIHNEEFIIDLNKLFNLDTFLINKLIFYWLYKSQVKFELSEKFLQEIVRFLKQPGSAKHQLHSLWFIEKKKNLAIIKK